PAEPAPAKPKPTPKAAPKQAVAKASPPPKPPAAAPAAPGYNPYDFGAAGAAGLDLGGSGPQPAAPPPRIASANPPPANVTKAPDAERQTPGLSKRSVILFAPQAADPAEAA